MSRARTAAPPSHLSTRSKRFWQDVVGTFEVDDAPALELLRAACEAIDRRDEAARLLKKDGLCVVDRYGQVKPHPAAGIEQSARLSLARLLRELRVLEPPEDARPPRLGRRS